MEEYLQVGVITRVHGVHGEVKVFPTTGDVNRFKKLKEVFLDTGKEKKLIKVVSVKFFKQFVILKFEGFDNANDVEGFRNMPLLVDREHAVKLNKDEYFFVDLIGLTVCDETDTEIGEITDVMETGANDVYEVTLKDGKSFLMPAIKQCVLDVDMENRKMKIHILDGLLD